MLIDSSNATPQLRALTERYSGLRLATREDNQAIAEFINSTSMTSGQLSVGFTRGNDYFSLLSLQADRYSALVCTENERIVGVGAFSTRKAIVRGNQTEVGYLQDLRVSHSVSHRVRQNFYKCFADFVKVSPQLEDFNHCGLFLTAILDENHPAKAALSRQSFPLEYSRLMGYTAHVWPKPPGLHKVLATPTQLSDASFNELLGFYKSNLGSLAFDLTCDDIVRLRDHSTPIVLIENGQIIAACLLVNTPHERQVRAVHKKTHLKFESSGTYISAFRISKSIAPEQRQEVRQQLLAKALQTSLQLPGLFTGLIVMDEESSPLSTLNRICDFKVGGSLYRVFHPEHSNLPEFSSGFLRPAHIPAFEWVFS